MKTLFFSPTVWISRSLGVLILRLASGIVFFMHGAQKIFGWFGGGGLDGTISFMSSLGIPTFMAYLASFWEFLGGIFLILGFLTRIWSAGFVIHMLVAIFTVHFSAGFFASDGGYEFNMTLLAVSLSLVFLGAGKYSIDQTIYNNSSVDTEVVH